MLRRLVVLCLLLSTNVAPARLLECRFEKIRRLEKQLAARVPESPVSEVTEVTLPAAQKEYDAMLKLLDGWGVQHQAGRKKNHLPVLTSEIEDGEIKGPRLDHTWLRRIIHVPSRQNADAGPLAPAFQHPRTKDLLKRLDAMNYRLYADPTVTLSGWGGMCFQNERYIALPPDATFTDLCHEFTHAEWGHFKIDKFYEKLGKPNANVAKLMEDYKGFGKERLAKIVKWHGEGYSSLAIEERLAVESEITLLDPQIHPEKIRSQVEYARWYLLDGMVEKTEERDLTLTEKKTFLTALAEQLEHDKDDPEEQAQYRAVKRLIDLLAQDGPNSDIRHVLNNPAFQIFRDRDVKRLHKRVAVAGLLTTALGAGGVLTINFGNGTSVQVQTPPDDDDEKKKKQETKKR